MRHLLGNIGTCKLVLEVSVSHGDSAISHPRDQDYLSLCVGKGSKVELGQALAYMVVTYANESEKRSKASVEKLEVILKLLTFKHNTRPCSLPGLRGKEIIMATHEVDAF